MIGSIIYQISKEPIPEENYIEEDSFCENFVGVIASHVSADTDRKENINDLYSELKEYGVIYNPEEDSIIFLEGFKEKYFAARFEKLKKALQSMSLKQFASDSFAIFEVMNLIEQKFGFYICVESPLQKDDFGTFYTRTWQSLDSFVRDELEEGEKYYIGGTLEYRI